MTPMDKQGKTAFILTHLIVAIIFFACLMMVGPMRDGFPVAGDLEARMAHIASNKLVWQLGWNLWMLAALGLLMFCTLLSHWVPPSPLRRYGLLLVALGIAPDLSAEVIYAYLIPFVMEQGYGLAHLAVLDKIAMLLTGFLGNGLYNLGGLLLTVLLAANRAIPRWVIYSGVVAWLLGIALTVSVALDKTALMEFFTASSMTLSTLWMLAVAHCVFRRCSTP